MILFIPTLSSLSPSSSQAFSKASTCTFELASLVEKIVPIVFMSGYIFKKDSIWSLAETASLTPVMFVILSGASISPASTGSVTAE